MYDSHAVGRKLVGRLTDLEQLFQCEATVNVEITLDHSGSSGHDDSLPGLNCDEIRAW